MATAERALLAPRRRAAVVHGNEELFERNGLARKIADRGVEVTRVVYASSRRAVASCDLSGLDLIVAIDSSLPAPILNDLRDRAAEHGIEFRRLPHKVSDPRWLSLSPPVPAFSDGATVVEIVPVAALPRDGKSQSKVAQEVEDTERLLEIALEENAKLTARAKRAEADLETQARSSDSVARQRLADDLSRANAERSQAVRDLASVQEHLIARAEAAETLKRRAQEEVSRISARLSSQQQEPGLEKTKTERDQLAAELRKSREDSASSLASVERARSRLTSDLASAQKENQVLLSQLEEARGKSSQGSDADAKIIRRVRAAIVALDAEILSPVDTLAKIREVL
jgi:hypothetical protein